MTAFIKHRQLGTPLGNRLREARLNRGITIKKASADLNIASKYLEALETQEPRLVPSREYYDKWLALYGDYLALSKAEMHDLKNKVQVVGQNQLGKKSNFGSVYEWLSRGLIIVAVSGLVFFLLYRVNAIFSPPPLQINSPQDGTVAHSRQLLVTGVTAREAELVINNKAVFVDQDGKFSTFVDLQSGLNLISITAQKRYSRPQEASVRVLFGE